jgi:hypothetical protein
LISRGANIAEPVLPALRPVTKMDSGALKFLKTQLTAACPLSEPLW